MTNEALSFSTAGGETTAYLARPDAPNSKAIIVIQEYWGLNDHIKDIANRYAFALRAACELDGFSAAAPFYGDIPPEDVLKKLTTPTIFVSARQDSWINPKKVAALEDATERFELPITSIKYDADHAFFNNTRPDVYDQTAARDAWALVIGFFRDRL
ncbi:MAG: dienelactone hydrolase family protein [Acidobacteria bacterium]|nr:dienelactone hydrolase family protein [Acidobacteriota bacterium]